MTIADRETLERTAIALAARGMLSLSVAQAVPSEALTSEARLLAWTCAVHVLRAGAPTFWLVRAAVVTVPRLEVPLREWAALMAEMEREIDAAERLNTLDPHAVDNLIETMTERNTEGDRR